jgi:hypothetical protein
LTGYTPAQAGAPTAPAPAAGAPAFAGAPPPQRLGLADQALACLMGFVACTRATDDRMAAVLAALAEVLPHVNRRIGPVAALAEAAQEVIAAAGARVLLSGTLEWCAALLTASAAVQEFQFWRGGQALDAFRAAQAPREDAA